MDGNDRIKTRGTRSTMVALLTIATLFVACGGGSNPSATGGSSQKNSTSTTQNSGGNGGSSGEGGSSEETKTKTIAGQQVNFKKSATVSGKSSVEIEADDFYFSPTVLKGKPGQTIKVELKNEGTVTHNFTLPSNHLSKTLSTGQSTELNITFPKSGTVLFHCAFHASQGMRGALQAS